MRKLIVTVLLSASLALACVPAQAGSRHYYGHGGYGHHHGHYDGDDLLIAGAIIGGALLLGALLTPRPYYGPAVQYRPAPQVVYVPVNRQRCYRERVYRYLADGRIQWGIRTTCY